MADVADPDVSFALQLVQSISVFCVTYENILQRPGNFESSLFT